MNSRRRVAALAAVPAAAVAVSLAGCGGAPATATVHGTVAPNGPSSVLGVGGDEQTYAGCVGDTPKPGTQVTVSSPSGTVIGTAALGLWSRQRVSAGGLTLYTCVMPFTITGVPSEQRYGFAIAGVPGTQWENSITSAVGLAVTSSS
jgi:hypothetical protein